MLPLLLLTFQTDDLSADVRLRTPLTVEERYLPLPEFAQRLQTATHATVKIAPDIADRKLALFVRGRPASETMRMAASALGALWVRTGGEWRLKSDPKVARDEEAAQEAARAARRAAVLAWAEGFAKDPGPSGEVPAVAKAAALVAKIGPAATADALIAGRSLIATTSGREGSIPMPLADAFDAAFPEAMMSLRMAEGTNFVTIRLTPLGNGVGGGVVTGVGVAPGSASSTDDDRHRAEWGVLLDPKVADAAMEAKPLEPEPYPSGLETLADALARLHERSGKPVAAESFRAPLRNYGEIPGRTVRESMAALAKEIAWTKAPFAWRAEGGWLLARPGRPWAVRPGEIPEARLRPLEGKDPTLDQYADLVAGLTEPQMAALNAYRPVVRFSVAPFVSPLGARALALYGTLSAEEREAVRGAGLPYARMTPTARARWNRAYGEVALDFPSNAGTYLDLVGGKIPNDAGLRVYGGATGASDAPGRPLYKVDAARLRYAADLFLLRLDPDSGFDLVVPIPKSPLHVLP